ncbi:prolactin receptor precursor [Xenopus laevis]|uniref:Prolactin receptor n=1 Tax=Xenopus laevis TaxID=8355 RepID=Q9IBF6_XENLA|nr:prolactin receptor precursor [Xenopus laevis]BAA90400.1 prolactin receptor [Xenopus laevis]
MPQNLAPTTPSVAVTFLLFLYTVSLNAQSLPGKPVIDKCRSYEKVTFSCWWKPGSDGGLPTNYSLLYRKENDPKIYECPDYVTSGLNSCFFDKAHTSFWIFYHIYVNATNALGSNVSDEESVDTTYIVQPYPPTNVSLAVESGHHDLLLKWLPPAMVDVQSGWLTLKYEVRYKEEKEQEWEAHLVGNQLKLKLFGLTPGGNYVVQVRCKPDSGHWSEWSTESYIQIPGGGKKTDLTLWISIGALSAVICLTMIWTMALKRCSLMSCILPPVPGPKIMGFDTQLLKSGKSDELLSALGCQSFPPTSDYDDLLVEFLEVDDSKQHLIASRDQSQQKQNIKVCPADTDNDSGRGSCDSPFSHSEGCKELRNLQPGVDSTDRGIHDHWPPQNTVMDGSFTNFSDNKSNMWPDVPSTGNQISKSSYQDIKDITNLAISAMTASQHELLIPCNDKNQLRCFKTIEIIDEEKTTKPSDFEDLRSKGVEADTVHLVPNDKPPFLPARMMDYVEVHKVSQNNALALIPKHNENSVRTDQYSVLVPNREYTKVERVEGNNVLVLMQEMVNQVNPVTIESTKLKFQQSQSANPMNMFSLAQNGESRTQAGGMGYMDPSAFLS